MCTTCGCGGHAVTINGRPMRREPRRQGGVLAFRQVTKLAANEAAKADVVQESTRARIIRVEQDILAKNDALAAGNRTLFANHGILALNLVSSPGSGKTTLLEHTLRMLKSRPVCGELVEPRAGERVILRQAQGERFLNLAVIEGDQQTDNDAARIRATGVEAIQINTGKGCHLDASMVERALQQMTLPKGGVLFIENVGNLVCPAAFELGEAAKVVVFSVTEGEDKPLKYPDMFRAARLMLLNKCDLLPHLDFDADLAVEYARRINPAIEVIRLSAKSGEGMDEWLDWITVGCRHTVRHTESVEA